MCKMATKMRTLHGQVMSTHLRQTKTLLQHKNTTLPKNRASATHSVKATHSNWAQGNQCNEDGDTPWGSDVNIPSRSSPLQDEIGSGTQGETWR